MTFEGQAVKVLPLDDGFVELRFDLENDSVNKLNQATLARAEAGPRVPAAQPGERCAGVLITSGKDVFIVGADITEFVPLFHRERGGDRRLPAQRAGDLLVARGPRGAERRRDQRRRAGRRLRAVPLRELPRDVERGEGRPARDEARHLPGLGRHRAPAARGRRRHRDRVDRVAASSTRAADALKAGAVDAVTAPADLREAALVMLKEAADGPARLARAPRGEEGAAEARPDRGRHGLPRRQGLRRRQGRPELPGAGGRHRRRSRRAPGKTRDEALAIEAAAVREGRQDRDRPLAGRACSSATRR